MKLALVRPPEKWIVDPCVYPPVGLGYLKASVLRECPDVQVQLWDMQGWQEGHAANVLSTYDIVGYSVTTPYYEDTVHLAYEVRKRNSAVAQIIGGAHATITRDVDPIFESAFYGQADVSLPQYLRDRSEGKQKREYDPVPRRLDDLPLPLCEVGKKLNYGGADRTAVIYTSLGCSHNCAFCAARAMYRKLEFRAISNVVKEIEMYLNRNVREIRFMDDSFTMNRKRLFQLCEAFSTLPIRWACMVRPDQLDEEMLGAMKRAGCSEVAIGAESFDDAVLKALNKCTTAQQNIDAITMAHRAGLNVHLFILASTPGETYPTTADLNIQAIESVRDKFVRMLFSVLMPHLGTPINSNPKKYGIEILHHGYSQYNQHQFVRDQETGEPREVAVWSPIRIKGMTREQQMENLRRMRDYCCSLPQVNKGKFT